MPGAMLPSNTIIQRENNKKNISKKKKKNNLYFVLCKNKQIIELIDK
jgi:hypothetical protein